jgi:integrase
MAKKANHVLPLNDKAALAAKAIDEKRTEYQIATERGLKLIVRESGVGTYVLRYEIELGAKRIHRKLTIGRRDAITVYKASDIADEKRREIAHGIDPVAVAEERLTAITFKDLAEDRFNRDSDLADSSKKLYREALEADVYSAIGDHPAYEVTPAQIVPILDKIENRGSLVQADRTKSAISGVFAWGRKRHAMTANPTAGLGKRSSSVERDRVLSDKEMSAFWRATKSKKAWLSKRMRLILQLAILTGQRRTEVAGARISELELDGKTPIWTLAGHTRRSGRVVRGRTKNRKAQVVPLSNQAVSLFREAIALAGKSPFVFPAAPKKEDPEGKTRLPHIHGESVSKAVRRLRADFEIDDVTIHDMRTAISTWLGDQGVRPDVIDRILNHKPRSVTRRHYNFALMDKFVHSAMQLWADHVFRISGESSPTIAKNLLARARIRPVPRRIRRKELVAPAETKQEQFLQARDLPQMASRCVNRADLSGSSRPAPSKQTVSQT